ncbi:helix-turn-helix domain-containing protein [Conexibacter sp. W3-3-2]|uniref:Uncharacterized protein n=1 Tax=Paraconexibacter algicola TaxID=2133960 RepID=A0A2T4ULE3_9ACTN|nr:MULTISPECIES: helix-turn-helix transcriptional regulator [Solirubrobacterales]MTD46418.1 helix-turn-helix domain-containing protein [Conexibacter sp. W3-3-2]PTL60066.1 hypothetical protein C7Y72_10625 [Paraconexibacter algicola]
MTSIEQVLSEFIEAWNSGRRPDVVAFLDRVAATDRDELAEEIGLWLEVAPTPDYDDATLASITADPRLQAALAAGAASVQPWSARVRALRERAGLAVEQVAERIAALVGQQGQEARTAAYLTRLEADELDERRVSGRLVSALAAALGADRDALLPGPTFTGRALAAQNYRAEGEVDASLSADFDALSRAAAAPAPARELDEIDRLFLGGPDA